MEEAHHTKKDQDRYLGRRKLKGSNNISSRAVGMSKNPWGRGSNYVVDYPHPDLPKLVGGGGDHPPPLAPQFLRPWVEEGGWLFSQMEFWSILPQDMTWSRPQARSNKNCTLISVWVSKNWNHSISEVKFEQMPYSFYNCENFSYSSLKKGVEKLIRL